MGLFKDRRRRKTRAVGRDQNSVAAAPRPEGHGGTDDHDDAAETSDEQLRIDVEQVLARELGALTIADSDDALQITPVTRERILGWITDYGHHYFVDSDGDVGGFWHSRLFYFLLFGTDTEILQIRGKWNRTITIDRIEEVLTFCNDWNTERLWPKAYFRVLDDGMIEVLGEVSVDYEHGASADQLDRTLSCGLGTATMLFDALDARYPDPARSAP